MEDDRIVDLYWMRDEMAIVETQLKYGAYCNTIAYSLLNNHEDAEECVDDTYVGAWNSIPPNRPSILSAYLGKITRRIALKKYRSRTAAKRGGGEGTVALEELEECIASSESVEEQIEVKQLAELIDLFLEKLSVDERRVFLRRYWYFDSVRDIAAGYGYGESKVKMMLKRTRDKLAVYLKKEGVIV